MYPNSRFNKETWAINRWRAKMGKQVHADLFRFDGVPNYAPGADRDNWRARAPPNPNLKPTPPTLPRNENIAQTKYYILVSASDPVPTLEGPVDRLGQAYIICDLAFSCLAA